LLERTLEFLDQQPRLFRYLYLHEEFLFELGGALGRAGQTADYLALLRRLRDGQPEMYFQCFGFYDQALLTEALRTGQRHEIPACLERFRQHPTRHIDHLAKVVDLLAWRGCEQELRELLEPTAQTIANSPDVLGGDFGLQWLTDLAIFPFLEAGDVSPEGLDRLWQAASAIGWLGESNPGTRDWLSRAVRMASRPNDEVSLDLKGAKNQRFHDDVGWSFAGWAHRTKGLPWSSARFLSITLLNYWEWREERKKPASRFGLDATRLDHYLAQNCRDFIGLDGVGALSTLQAFHYFTDYLVAHGYFSVADAAQLQSAAAGFYQTIRGTVDAGDSAYRICPTYEALISPKKDLPLNPPKL
jgi:hypothetical protein